MNKLLLILLFGLSGFTFSKSFEKRFEDLNSKRKAKLTKVAKRLGYDLSTLEGKKAFGKKLKEKRRTFKNLSPAEKEEVLNKRIVNMRKRLKEKGLSDSDIEKRISKRKKRFAKRLKRNESFQRTKGQ